MRMMLASALILGMGSALILSQLRWFSRPRLVERLRPYSIAGLTAAPRNGVLSVSSFREIVAPLSRTLGERVARLLGVSEELSVRLDRIHSDLDVTTFRVRQVGWTCAAFGMGLLLTAAARPPMPAAILL